jgi:hypothetical protein
VRRCWIFLRFRICWAGWAITNRLRLIAFVGIALAQFALAVLWLVAVVLVQIFFAVAAGCRRYKPTRALRKIVCAKVCDG